MDSIVGVIKRIAEHEVQRIHTTEIGIVTAVFPHADASDRDNYQCSIKLKNKKLPDGGDFELRRVPVATPYMGLAAIPNVGDLVLVTFAGGDINAPIIIGCLYNDEDRPPANKKQEFLLQHTIKDGPSIKLDDQGKMIVTSKNKKNTLTVEDEKVAVKTQQCNIVIEGAAVTIDNGSCKIKLEGGGITLDAGSNPINIKSLGSVTIAGPPTAAPVGDNDDILLTTHTHLGNLGAPCPILIPTEKMNSFQAKARKTKVG